MINRRNTLVAIVSAFVMVAWMAPVVSAQAKDASGTWKWTQAGGFGRRGGGGGAGGGAGGGGAAAPGAPATQPGAGGAAGAAPGGGGGQRGGGRGGQPRDYSLTVKQDGEKLTGKITGANFQDPTAAEEIKEGSVKNNEVTFKVVRDFNGNSITTVYKGKLEGDTITGTSLLDFGGNAPGGFTPQPVEWVAKRDTTPAK